VINKKNYREFYTDQEAKEWAMRYFGQWIKGLEKDKYKLDTNEISDLLYFYCGSVYREYNDLLRGMDKDFTKDEAKEYFGKAAIIEKEIRKFELQEDIIVYRFTKKEWLRWLFDGYKLRTGNIFTDKAFMSTTLVVDLLREFASKNHYNCILKLYLPKGTKGAYVKFNKKSRLNEHEFLLPQNSTFKLIKKRYDFKRLKWIYECELISQ
jgi:hypothetical protein